MQVFVCLVALGTLFSIEKKETARPPLIRPVGAVEVWLGESVDKIQGFTYPRDEKGRMPPFAAQKGSHEITVHFPSGRSYTAVSDYLLLSQKKGTVTEVTFAPIPGYVRFHTAVEMLEREARKVRFQNPWDLFERLAEWRKLEQPPRIVLAGTGIVEERVTLYLRTRGQESEGEEVWWGTMDFSYWLDEKLWEDYKKP